MVGMMTPTMIEIRQGDTFNIVIQIKDNLGKPVDVTDVVVHMQVRQKDGGGLVFSKNAEIIDATKGQLRIKLGGADTNIAVGEYVTDIQAEFGKTDVHTIWPQNLNKTGLYKITEQVTR